MRRSSTCVDDAEHDASVSAVVLHGRPGRFSAGFDLSVMRGDDVGAIADLVCDGGMLVRHMYGAKIPIVAACTGHALAAGALVLLGCDLRIGADVDCKIGLNEVAIAMVLPDWAFTIAVDRLSKRHLQRARGDGPASPTPPVRSMSGISTRWSPPTTCWTWPLHGRQSSPPSTSAPTPGRSAGCVARCSI